MDPPARLGAGGWRAGSGAVVLELPAPGMAALRGLCLVCARHRTRGAPAVAWCCAWVRRPASRACSSTTRFLGLHRGNSTPFCVELTGALRPGANRLLIGVDNTRLSDGVPMRHFDWFNYGGLHREVTLLDLPAIFIRAWSVALVPGSGFARLRVGVALSDPIDGAAVLNIPTIGISAEVPIAAGRGVLELAAAPALWSPERPLLHDLRLRFGEDEVRDRVGFREIAVRGHDILLNGRSIRLRGIAVHEDDLALGRVTTEADLRRRFAEHARWAAISSAWRTIRTTSARPNLPMSSASCCGRKSRSIGRSTSPIRRRAPMPRTSFAS